MCVLVSHWPFSICFWTNFLLFMLLWLCSSENRPTSLSYDSTHSCWRTARRAEAHRYLLLQSQYYCSAKREIRSKKVAVLQFLTVYTQPNNGRGKGQKNRKWKRSEATAKACTNIGGVQLGTLGSAQQRDVDTKSAFTDLQMRTTLICMVSAHNKDGETQTKTAVCGYLEVEPYFT